MDTFKENNKYVQKITLMLVIVSTIGLMSIGLDYIPKTIAQNTFMTPDQQSR